MTRTKNGKSMEMCSELDNVTLSVQVKIHERKINVVDFHNTTKNNKTFPVFFHEKRKF